MSDDKIKLLFDESFDPDERLIASLKDIAGIDDVHMVVGMVDLHLKKNTENPSSVAIATRERLIPKLSSVAQNCGMAIAATNLTTGDAGVERLEELFGRMRAEDDTLMRHPGMSVEDMRRAACLGAPWAAEKAGLPVDFPENIEFGGAVGRTDLLSWKELGKLVPRYSLDRGRYGFGVIPAGNHFLEIQAVDEVIDGEECERHGIRENGIMIMIHSDGGLISDDIGNLYGNRTTAKGYIRALYNVRKTALHLRDWRGVENWKEKKEYYFGAGRYIQISPGTDEGKRFLKAKDLSMNAGYASRVTTMGRVKRLMGEVFPEGPFDMRLLCDFSHNSIFRETIDGSPVWVHRHNACRVVEGQLVFLPGYSNTSSYICAGSSGARDFLNTMDHGAGKTIDRLKKKGLVRELGNGRVTRSYNNESPEPKQVPHVSDEGIDAVIESLGRNDIVRPVARLRPMAGYRYLWKGRLARAREKITAG